MRFVHEPVQTTCAIEQRILGVQVQMNELGMRHSSTTYRPYADRSKHEMFTEDREERDRAQREGGANCKSAAPSAGGQAFLKKPLMTSETRSIWASVSSG
jgi:hypothetical protein